ncbi:hypothetical protein DQQ10_19855 [Pseudochryseolinea flava]|uniref:Uncharacterized protein n=1 Tax=Pseudochryseolinea flava TaxID=2059302 RepID=A0A364XXH5_9BACT|nr:hypothetical protein DQQ10_19855 [Pseudochryseolinea flava]
MNALSRVARNSPGRYGASIQHAVERGSSFCNFHLKKNQNCHASHLDALSLTLQFFSALGEGGCVKVR